MNIILIGFMGSGKSTVGKILSEILDFNFIDIDSEIEKIENLKIKEIFRIYGEDFFRVKEKEILKKLINSKKNVIATGGGIVVDKKNQQILKRLGIIFFLKISKHTFTERVKYDNNRPLKSKQNLFKIRQKYYKNLADYIISSDYNEPFNIAYTIKNIYENCCR